MPSRQPVMAVKPTMVPIQKSLPSAERSGRPYCPHLRRSIKVMIRAARAAGRRLAVSRALRPSGVRLDRAKPPLGGFPPRATMMTPATTANAMKIAPAIATKISKRHPARIPFGPRKTVFGGGGGVVSGGGGGAGRGMLASDMAQFSGGVELVRVQHTRLRGLTEAFLALSLFPIPKFSHRLTNTRAS